MSSSNKLPKPTQSGTNGDDLINRGTAGPDVIDGKAGDDSIYGFGGNDILIGGTGADYLNGGSSDAPREYRFGTDGLLGDRGDTVSFLGLGKRVEVNLDAGTALSGSDRDKLVDIEIVVGTRFSDDIRGSGLADYLEGQDGADTIRGGWGNDLLLGDHVGSKKATDDKLWGEGNDDRLIGFGGSDQLDGGAGNDIVDYYYTTRGVVVDLQAGTGRESPKEVDTLLGIEAVNGGTGADTLKGNGAANSFTAGNGNDTLDGRGGNDDLNAGNGNDALTGGDGHDTLRGGNGNDTLDGGAGFDTLDGGAGNDQLTGGDGNDDLTGGNGNDTFYFSYAATGLPPGVDGAHEGQDTIFDFRRGADKLSIDIIAAPAFPSGPTPAQIFAELDSNDNGKLDDGDEHVRVETVGFGQVRSTVIETGDLLGVGGDTLTLVGVLNLTLRDFV